MTFDNKYPKSIHSLFNQIAPNYDIINDLMSFGLQKKIKISAVKNAIKHFGRKPQKVLDICCGTGDISILFKKICPDADVVGIDFSEEMLNIAKAKAPNINFLKEDIMTYTNTKARYDICFISFGLRNLPDIDEFLEKAKHFLNNDGVLAILDLGKPKLLLKFYFFMHFNIIIPLVAKLFRKDISPYKYLISSAKKYPSQKEILKKLIKHGYTKIENKNFSFGIIATQTAKYSRIGE